MALIEECLICFEDMAVFYTTNCGHKYCYSCVKQITTCSYCRQPITDVKPPAYLSCVKGLRRLDPSILKAINGDKEMFSDIIDASGIFNVIHEPTFDQPVFEKYVFPMLEGRRQQMEYFIASQYVAIGENIIRWKYGVCGVFEAGNVTAFDEIWKMTVERWNMLDLRSQVPVVYNGIDYHLSTVELADEDGNMWIMSFRQYVIYLTDAYMSPNFEKSPFRKHECDKVRYCLENDIRNMTSYTLYDLKQDEKSEDTRIVMQAIYGIVKISEKVLMSKLYGKVHRVVGHKTVMTAKLWKRALKYVTTYYGAFIKFQGDYAIYEK